VVTSPSLEPKSVARGGPPPASTYEGAICRQCNSTLRYSDSKRCVNCVKYKALKCKYRKLGKDPPPLAKAPPLEPHRRRPAGLIYPDDYQVTFDADHMAHITPIPGGRQRLLNCYGELVKHPRPGPSKCFGDQYRSTKAVGAPITIEARRYLDPVATATKLDQRRKSSAELAQWRAEHPGKNRRPSATRSQSNKAAHARKRTHSRAEMDRINAPKPVVLCSQGSRWAFKVTLRLPITSPTGKRTLGPR
jgi:hypothetical protein